MSSPLSMTRPIGMPGRHNEKVCIRAAKHGFTLILQIFHRVCDSGLAAVQLLIGVDHDGRYTGVRRVCQYVRALQTSAVFAFGAAVLQAAAERVGVAEAVIENGSGQHLRIAAERQARLQSGGRDVWLMFS